MTVDTSAMRACVFHHHGGPEQLHMEEVPVPRIGRGEALVRVRACALNHLDVWLLQGIPAYSVPLPHILGSDVSGVVECVGPDVEGIQEGDEVIVAPGLSCFRCEWCLSGNDNLCERFQILGAQVDGGYAEFVRVPAINLIPKPKGLSFVEAAAFPLTFLTAWHMLIHRARVQPGDRVLVLGAGSGIGSAAVQIARLAGARVFATVGDEAKVKPAQELGAEVVINHATEDFTQVVRDRTRGRGVDVVFEHVGPTTWAQSLASLAPGGRLVTCGATTGPEVSLVLRDLYMKQKTVLGSIMGTRAELLTLTRLVGEGRLRPVVDTVYPLEEARAAHERMARRDFFGKLVLEVQ